MTVLMPASVSLETGQRVRPGLVAHGDETGQHIVDK
jgi:hypothetical protein